MFLGPKNTVKKSTSIAASLQLSGLILLCAFFLVFFYTALHEGGHALAALACGGTVRHLDVNFFDLSAHAALDGTFTAGQQALISLSGWGLPVLVYLLFLLAGCGGAEPLRAALRWIGGIAVLGSTLPWVVLPLVYLGNGRPSDDVISFLTNSGLSPLAVSLVFAALVIAGIWLIRTGRGELMALRNWLRAAEPPLRNPVTRRTLAVMLLLTAVLGGGLALINGGGQAAAVPPGYRLAAEFDLNQASPAGVTLYAFDLKNPGSLGVYLLVRNVRTDTLDVSLRKPDGALFPLLHGEGYSTTEEVSNPAWEEMPAGHYQVMLTGSPARGTIILYLKTSE